VIFSKYYYEIALILAIILFFEAFQSCGDEWLQKKLISFGSQSQLRKLVPKQFEFISVELNDGDTQSCGLAQIIGDGEVTSNDFGLDVILSAIYEDSDPMRIRS
jgi:hypothetical protein